jgi:hypothetical protein
VVDAGSEGVSVGAEPAVAIGADGLAWIAHGSSLAALSQGSILLAHCADLSCSRLGANHVLPLSPLGGGGGGTSLAVGPDGGALVATRGGSSLATNVEVAHCADAACRTGSRATLNQGPGCGWFPSLAFGADGLGVIASSNQRTTALELAFCEHAACSRATVRVLDQGPPNES